MPIHVGVVSLELQIPGARSLKEKRRAVKSFIERVHRRFRVSIAETDYHDLHQRSEISLAVLTQDAGELERILETLRGIAEEMPDALLLRWEPRHLRDDTLDIEPSTGSYPIWGGEE